MINLNFFPSRRMAVYMARLFITRSLAVLLALVLVLMTLDLLGESGKILEVPGNGEAELWRYVSYRVPMLIDRFLPFAALLGTLITFTTMNQNSEIVAMKAAGLSAHQILAPLVLASLGIALISFMFSERVVTNATRAVTAWEDNDYKPMPPDSGVISSVWLMAGDDLVRARQVIGRGSAARVQGVIIYERDGNRLTRIIEAERGRQADGGWLLEGVSVYDSSMNFIRRLPELRALDGVEPQRFTLAKVDPESRSFADLSEAIAALKAAGRPSSEAEAGLWHKVSKPLSTILMPLLAAVAAFGLARSGKVLLRATVGMALGFAYFVADNFAIAMGNVGAYPPLLAAWAPFFLFLLIGEMVLIRSEE